MTALEPNRPSAMTEAEFERFRFLLRDRAGLAFDQSAKYLLERRIVERLRETDMPNFDSYLSLLESDPGEQDAVFWLVTTKETYFFRQEYQLGAFVNELLPLLVEAQGQQRRLTVWSAGCATGEEAYTIAMLLLESPLLEGWRIRVLGTDLCQQNVDAAVRGVYRRTSFRTTSKSHVSAYFTEVAPGTYAVKDELRRVCHFSRVNLLSDLGLRTVGRVDVAFCRNVIIYFDEESRRKVTDAIYQRLLPGGYLLLGHSESLLNTETRFVPVHLEGDLVYQRPHLTTITRRPVAP